MSRFGVPAASSDEEDGYSSFASLQYTSDEYESDSSVRSFRAEPVTEMGRRLRACYDSSDDEEGLESDYEVIGDLGSYRTPRASSRRAAKITASVDFPVAESSKAPWQRAQMQARINRAPEDVATPYEGWLKSSEAAAMRDGQRSARERRSEMSQLTDSARKSIRNRQKALQAQEEEDMTRLLESLAIQHLKVEEETRQLFAEREKKLWADIDAAIAEVERADAERARLEEEERRRREEEEAERARRAEEEAKRIRAEAERRAREHAENAQRSAEERARAQRQDAERQAGEARAAEEERRRAAENNRTETEWKKWVEKQKWMKNEVITAVKGDRQTRMSLKAGMRLVTRGLGQVVNTKETIIRVAGELHNILVQQLPSPPSETNPTRLDNAPKPYLYLLSHMSKALIKQAESEVSATASAAFPLGRVVYLLLLHGHAALGEVLFARLNKKCPWVIPHYPRRAPDQPREEYEKSTGRGSDESVQDYIARMNGIITLYLAIIQTPIASFVPDLPYQLAQNHLVSLVCEPLRFTSAWSWIALALKDPLPGSPPMATMLQTWVEVVGAEAMQVFGAKQVGKIFEAILREGVVEGGKIKGDSESARQQLGMLLSDPNSIRHPEARVWE